MHAIRARQMLRSEDVIHMNSFSTDTIEGRTVRLERGQLGLCVPTTHVSQVDGDMLSAIVDPETKTKTQSAGADEARSEKIAVAVH